MDSEYGALSSAIAIVAGANPIIAGAVGVIGGIFGGWFATKEKDKTSTAIQDDEKTQQLLRDIIQQQIERDEARKNRGS